MLFGILRTRVALAPERCLAMSQKGGHCSSICLPLPLLLHIDCHPLHPG